MPQETTQAEKIGSTQPRYQRDALSPAMQRWSSQSKQEEPWSHLQVPTQPTGTRATEPPKL
ncbi:unnamed protein product [Fusarium fujikuroi]|uniref:Uncharacterized protein n=1 Tax=Fusarium fujikuroi TaxID=5127 RepID=A0A2H3RXQ3_FUSFU|nr:uncharacterized protein FFE2_02427 [Fusarium fujikuroi]SCO03270.1 uncharacterized protein FFC1_09261 [Fusarium fujikuroi]SCO35523.1 uncharacterized protein FFNC_04539 [Fusarium fujikuroi]SCV37061.1 uncharacterized protein FFFS_05490 [Fusarium fujikuroi]VTT55222.1 unnamed protein product [Fusarium fujikuroi]